MRGADHEASEIYVHLGDPEHPGTEVEQVPQHSIGELQVSQ